MQRIFRAGPMSYQWLGRCTVDSNRPDQYIHHQDWPTLSSHTGTFTAVPLTTLLSEHYWEEEEVDPDLEVAERL